MDGEIYLDNNATTRPLPEVRRAMLEALDEGFGNPSSDHARGRRARDAIWRARSSVAALLGADPSRLIFTSSATEANNIILASAAARAAKRGPARLITTAVEHSSVLNVCEHFVPRGVEVEHVPVDADGIVDLDRLRQQLARRTFLVCVQWANNETGVVQPIADIAEICREHGALVHVDAAQAIGKLPIDLRAVEIDLMSVTAHKIHGPVGAGAIYARDLSLLEPLCFGGQQESGLRPGTENVAAIVGFGVSAELRFRRFAEIEQRLRQLRDEFEERLLELVSDVCVNGGQVKRLPNGTNLRFTETDGQALVARLDQAGVRCSQSSACTSRRPTPSHVLRAMRLSADDAWSSVRFAFGELNTADDARTAAALVAEICSKLRRFSARRMPKKTVEVG